MPFAPHPSFAHLDDDTVLWTEYVDLADYSASEASALILERVHLNELPQAR